MSAGGLQWIITFLRALFPPCVNAAFYTTFLKVVFDPLAQADSEGIAHPFPAVPNIWAYIIGGVLLTVGLAMFGIAMYMIIYSEVTMKNLQNRLINVRDNIHI
ncbi:MAG: hypothetical protein LBR15_03890 [Methanobrevibacter sp.]|jgi:hypothetical protein|nr:hypothetical protein [Candidatus Methanovirga australis]